MKWIKCSNELPPEGQTVLCYRKIIVTGWYCKEYCPYEKKRKGWHCDWNGLERATFKRYPVTHWMYLPDQPNEDDEWIQKDYDNMMNRMWIPIKTYK